MAPPHRRQNEQDKKREARADESVAFVVKTTDGLFVRLLLGATFSGLLAAGITLLVASEGTGEWPPQQLTYVAMVAIGVIVALTVSLFILLRAALRSLVRVRTQPEQVGSALPASESSEQARHRHLATWVTDNPTSDDEALPADPLREGMTA